jgi:hypothetical protein
MYLPDLSPYRHEDEFPDGRAVSGVVAIGWLQRDHPFPLGDVSPSILSRLEHLIVHAPVNRMRGWHVCDLCSEAPAAPLVLATPSGSVYLGMTEIWVPGATDEVIYSSPSLVHHYIAAHRYQPPEEFQSAVTNLETNQGWDAGAEFDRRIRALYE